MTDADWSDTQARAIAVYLDGQDAPDQADDGTPLTDDDLFICANAWWESLEFTIPTQDPGTSWTVLVDTADPSVGRTESSSAPSPQLSNGDRITVAGRAIAVVLGTR
jgi:glycogen operon protein